MTGDLEGKTNKRLIDKKPLELNKKYGKKTEKLKKMLSWKEDLLLASWHHTYYLTWHAL